jgi:hypothetical protein
LPPQWRDLLLHLPLLVLTEAHPSTNLVILNAVKDPCIGSLPHLHNLGAPALHKKAVFLKAFILSVAKDLGISPAVAQFFEMAWDF